jgi:hypothetical protein
MKVQNHILRLLSLIMLMCVLTTHQASAMSKQQVCAADQEQPVFKELSHGTTVPHYDFSFGVYDHFFVENSSIAFPESISLPGKDFSDPQNSYLAKLLEHHIAINAP